MSVPVPRSFSISAAPSSSSSSAEISRPPIFKPARSLKLLAVERFKDTTRVEISVSSECSLLQLCSAVGTAVGLQEPLEFFKQTVLLKFAQDGKCMRILDLNELQSGDLVRICDADAWLQRKRKMSAHDAKRPASLTADAPAVLIPQAVRSNGERQPPILNSSSVPSDSTSSNLSSAASVVATPTHPSSLSLNVTPPRTPPSAELTAPSTAEQLFGLQPELLQPSSLVASPQTLAELSDRLNTQAQDDFSDLASPSFSSEPSRLLSSLSLRHRPQRLSAFRYRLLRLHCIR